MNYKGILENIGAIILPLLLIMFIYDPVIFHPSEYLFSLKGDGLKNYYSFTWFLDNNDAWIHHSGMNYPYGDHYIYTDGFFVIGWLCKSLGISGITGIGIINLLMMLSPVVSAFFLYKVLKIYRVPGLLAIVGATAIAIMSPQVDRMGGHYALAISFSFPLTLYLMVKFFKEDLNSKYSIFLFINNLFWFFIHPYLGMIATLFNLSVWLVRLLFQWWVSRSFSFPVKDIVLQSILPLVVLTLFMSVTDTHSDRPEKPTGFWEANASIKSLFVPTKGPLNMWQNRFDMKKEPWEGRAYTGLGTFVLLVFLLLRFIVYRKLDVSEIKNGSPNLSYFFIGSVLVLIFSFGIPFYQLPSLVEVFSPVRNFRAIGRFSWAFFYVASLFVIIQSYNIVQNKSNVGAWILVLFFSGASLFEGLNSHFKMAEKALNSVNYFNPEALPIAMKDMLNELDKEDVLAIMPLPYFHVGSESFTIHSKKEILLNTILLSYHSGLPILSSQLSRTSVTEAKKSMTLVSPEFYDKAITDEIGPGNVLLYSNKEGLKEMEKSYLDRSTKIYVSEKNVLAKISVDEISKTTKSIVLELDSLYEVKDNLYVDSIDLPITYLNYRNLPGGTLNWEKGKYISKELPVEEVIPGIYEVKIWYRLAGNGRPNTSFFVETADVDGSNGKWESFETLDKSSIFSGASIEGTRSHSNDRIGKLRM